MFVGEIFSFRELVLLERQEPSTRSLRDVSLLPTPKQLRSSMNRCTLRAVGENCIHGFVYRRFSETLLDVSI